MQRMIVPIATVSIALDPGRAAAQQTMATQNGKAQPELWMGGSDGTVLRSRIRSEQVFAVATLAPVT